MRVIFIGSGYLGLGILEGLLDSLPQTPGLTLVGMMPWSLTEKGKSLVDDGEVKLLAQARQAGVRLLEGFSQANHPDFIRLLEDEGVDVLLMGCWGEILKPPLLGLPGLKIVNCHPSLLPAHRGSNPYSSVIRQGERETGVTFHWANAAIDDGPIVLQAPVAIAPDETGGSLREKCRQTTRRMIPELMRALATANPDDAPPQPAEGKSYYPQITLTDGLIQWHLPIDEVSRRLRALKPWLSSYAWLEGRLLYIFHDLPLAPRPAGVPQNAAPGTILARRGWGRLLVQSGDPGLVYICQDYQIYLGTGFLPRWCSRLLSGLLARRGYRFTEAFTGGVVSAS